jgi:hypothetical protein
MIQVAVISVEPFALGYRPVTYTVSILSTDFSALPIRNQEENSAAKARLIAALDEGRLIGMTGAGPSAWAGYPLWNGALNHLADLVTEITGDVRRGADLLAQNMDMLFCAQRLGRVVGDAAFAAINSLRCNINYNYSNPN